MKASFFRSALFTFAASFALQAQQTLGPPSGAEFANIDYHNGPILTQATHVYLLWYGNWANTTSTDIVPFFVRNLAPSPYWDILTSYYQAKGGNVEAKNDVILAGQTFASSSNQFPLGKSLSDANIWTFVQDALNGKGVTEKLPTDTGGVYMVLTSQGVAETSGFGTKYCGFHTFHALSNGSLIQYIFVGEPTPAQAGACSFYGEAKSPNNNWQADAMVNIMAGKLAETITDPLMTAWYDHLGYEMATKCAWTFGPTMNTNGANWNVMLGGQRYLIQELWVAGLVQACALAY